MGLTWLKRDLSDSLLKSDPPNVQVHLHSEDPLDMDALVRRYNTTFSKFIHWHSLLKTKTLKVRLAVPWYNDEIMAAKRLRRKAERSWKRTRSLSDLNIFKSYRNRVRYLMNQAGRRFTITLFTRIALTIKGYSELPSNCLLRKRSRRFLIIRINQN